MPGAEPPRRSGRPLFLARASYRRRRLFDAARLAPLAAGFLWALPLLWPTGDTRLSHVLVYVFATWGASVVAALVLARALRRAAREEEG